MVHMCTSYSLPYTETILLAWLEARELINSFDIIHNVKQ